MEKECCICFGSQWMITTPCFHNICLECLIKLRKDECPLCRSSLIDKLPDTVQSFFKLENTKTLNIFDEDQFPRLSDHPFS